MQHAAPSAELLRRVFGRYVDSPIWVAWEARPHSNPEKEPIKVPINPMTGREALSNDPTTWAPMGRALALAQRNHLAGIGIMLGPDPDQNPNRTPEMPHIVGVDYDNALRADGTLMPWAQDLMLDGTYAEVSPSGTGIKAFAFAAQKPEGIPTGQDGCTLKLGHLDPAVANGKRPAVEVYAGRRWFAVTGRIYGTCDTIADMSARLPVLLRNARPAPVATLPSPPGEPDTTITASDARYVHAQALTDEQRAHLTYMLHAHADLAAAMTGDDWADRSQALFAAADLAKGHRISFEQFVHGLMAATGAAGNHVREQPDPYRALARAWERSPQPLPLPSPNPVPEGARIGDRPGVTGDGYANIATAPSVDLTFLDQPNPLGTPYTLPLDLYANPPPLPEFILTGLFPCAPGALVGTGGVMKSTLWMSMALNMILARPLWNVSWRGEGTALMISKEDERSIMLRRLFDLLHGMNVTERQYRDIISNRFFLDDYTESPMRLVESDGKGNLHATPEVGSLIDKYAGRNVTFAAIDPMVNFGPGETHGNDGAAMMMQVAWRLSRGWREQGTSLVYIHHLSMASAREEVEDAHAGRSASAIGDNARNVWVLHRHKVQNTHRHVAPPSIPADAIERGDVIRLIHAKNSYARRITEPFWAWRDGNAIQFVEPLASAEARAASAAMPTAADIQRQARQDAMRTAFISYVSQFARAMTKSEALINCPSNVPRTTSGEIWDSLVADGLLIAPDRMRPAAYMWAGSISTNQAANYGF